MDKSRFGTFINLLRKEKGITQKELADILHVTDKAVSRWETGKSYPDIEVMQDIAVYFDVTVNELLQGERISEDKIKTVSDKNIVSAFKRLKKDKNRFEAVIAILVAVVVILGCVLVTPIDNLLHGVKTTKLEITSNDTEAVLSCVDGYISSETGGPAELYEVDIMMHGDKTIEQMHIDGASAKGTTFFCSVEQDLKAFPYIYIHEDKDSVQVDSHINTENMKGFVNAVDLKEFDEDFSENARYNVMLVEMCDEDYEVVQQNDNKKYLYDLLKESFREVKPGDIVPGPFAWISISKFDEDGRGFSYVDVYWPVEVQGDYYVVYDGKGQYTDSYGNAVDNMDDLTDDKAVVSRLVMSIEDEILSPSSYTEIRPWKVKGESKIYPEITILNNEVCILTESDGSGWKLKKGDSLVYGYERMENKLVEDQALLIGVIQDGVMKEGITFRSSILCTCYFL
jgi:transcriptional regulator with XRE-family HTH domain